jgi:hypothetical protein
VQRANEEITRALGDRAPAPAPPAAPRIRLGDALELNWNAVGRCHYVVGNPPFVAKRHRTAAQAAGLRRVFGGAPGHGELDYAAAWLELASRYVRGRRARVAFVITSSLAQGEQVPALWPRLLERGMRIDFAHRPFPWEACGGRAAAVSVAIVGFSHGGWRAEKLLYDRGGPRAVPRINPYLAAAPDVIVRPRRRPLAGVPPIRFGSMPNDGGHLVLGAEERAAILAGDPVAAGYVRELVGARSLMDGRRRWCLWLVGADPAGLGASATLRARVEAVRRHRAASARATTRRLAATPALFGEIRQPAARYLCVPRHGSAQRRCAPMAFAEPDAIAHDSTLTIAGASLHLFGVLQSAMFTTWLHAVGGRIKGDPRISAELVYNTFPWPRAAGPDVSRAARRVLAVRAAHPGHSLDWLYDPRTMPRALSRAHDALDAAVDALYGGGAFDEAARLALLLERYSAMAGAAYASTTIPLSNGVASTRRNRVNGESR